MEQGYSLVHCASEANRAHREVLKAERSMLTFALEAGVWLNRARPLIPLGNLERWVLANCDFTFAAAARYMRLDHFRELIPPEAISMGEALDALKNANAKRPNVGARRLPPLTDDELKEVCAMKAAGASWPAIGKSFGRDHQAIRYAVDKEWREKQAALKKSSNARRRAAEKALKDQERSAAVKRHGGQAANAYALIRKAAVALDAAVNEHQSDPDAKGLLQRALGYVYKAEEEVVFAIRADRRTERAPIRKRPKAPVPPGPAPGERRVA